MSGNHFYVYIRIHTKSLNTKSEFPICLAQCHWLFPISNSVYIYRYLYRFYSLFSRPPFLFIALTLEEECNLFGFALNRASFHGRKFTAKINTKLSNSFVEAKISGARKKAQPKETKRKKENKRLLRYRSYEPQSSIAAVTLVTPVTVAAATVRQAIGNQKRSCHLIYDLLTLAVY